MRHTNILIIGVPEGEEREGKEQKKIIQRNNGRCLPRFDEKR